MDEGDNGKVSFVTKKKPIVDDGVNHMTYFLLIEIIVMPSY